MRQQQTLAGVIETAAITCCFFERVNSFAGSIPLFYESLALMVEGLCVALTGAALSCENDSYFEPGNRPRIGHAFLAIDPGALAGAESYAERLEALVSRMIEDDGVRLPGARRHEAAARARSHGFELADALGAELKALARG